METNLLKIIKLQLGISSTLRDELLKFLIKTTISELKSEHNLIIDDKEEGTTINQFIIDYVCFKYKNSEYKGVPRFLQFRLNNLKINKLRSDKNDL